MIRPCRDMCDPLEGWKERIEHNYETILAIQSDVNSLKPKVLGFEDMVNAILNEFDIVSGIVEDLGNEVDLNNERINEVEQIIVTIETAIENLQIAVQNRVIANASITPGTATKITYDTKGLVTAGASLAEADIPALSAGKITSGAFADARIPTLAISKTTGLQSALDAKIPTSVKGSPNGVAELDATGKVPSGQLPSYVDDVLEYASLAGFPTTGESGKIYVAIDTNKTYRWSGTGYVEISPSLALGETSATAYRGDRGAQAYAHISATNNPHSVTKAQVGLTNVADVLQYSASNPPPYPVTSVAGKTGAVVLAEVDIPALSAGKITSGTFADARIPNLNGSKITAGTVADARLPTTVERTSNKKSAWQTTPTDTAYPTEKLVKDTIDAHTGNTSNPHSVTKAQVGLTNVANVLQYSASNAPPYPVTSVAGKTGAVTLAEADIPALSAGKITSGTFADARIPNLNASKVTGGTFADARIPALAISKITGLQTALDGKQTKGDGLHNAEASYNNNASLDLYHVDLNGPISTVNAVSHVAVEDASTLINSPISSGAFYAVRSVEFTPRSPNNTNLKVIVTLKETYPIPGRVWTSVFNMDYSSWSGWKSHNTGGWVTTWARDDNPSAYPNGLKSGIHNKSLFGGAISPHQRFRVLFYDNRTDMFSVVHCCSSGSNRVFSGPIVSSAEYMNNITAWFNAFHFENNGNDVYLQMKAVEVNQNVTWREDDTQAIWKIEKWVD